MKAWAVEAARTALEAATCRRAARVRIRALSEEDPETTAGRAHAQAAAAALQAGAAREAAGDSQEAAGDSQEAAAAAVAAAGRR